MKALRLCLLTLAVSLMAKSGFCQSLQRSVVANAAETLVSPDKNLSLTFVLGEVVGDFLPNAAANVYFTVGFLQPDNELQPVLNRDLSKYIVLYPNPASGNLVKLAFNNNMPDGNYTIEIIDPIGRLLQSQTVRYQNNNFFYIPLDVSQLKGGTYFVRVNNRSGFNTSLMLIKI